MPAKPLTRPEDPELNSCRASSYSTCTSRRELTPVLCPSQTLSLRKAALGIDDSDSEDDSSLRQRHLAIIARRRAASATHRKPARPADERPEQANATNVSRTIFTRALAGCILTLLEHR